MVEPVTLHRISTKALLNALPPIWAKGTNYLARLERRSMGDVILDLLRARDGYISMAELIDYLYGDEENGGPDDADNLVRVKIHRMRRKGHAIRTHGHRGYSVDKAA